jgi:hypothetical protein
MGFQHHTESAKANAKHVARLWLYCVGLPVLAIALVGIIASVAEAVPQAETQRCFPAKQWGPAPDSVRPCVSLIGNFPERGAIEFVVADASGVVRYSGFVNTTFNHVAHVKVAAVYEDGSLRYVATNFNGKRAEGGIGNLQD